MPLDLNTALNAYGFVGQLANAIPDLRGILNQAIQGEWVPEQFDRALQDSPWWKTNAENVRKLATLQGLDPATYNQNLNNATNKVQLMAQQMGRAGINSPALALQALSQGWDDEQIRSAIAFASTATPNLVEGTPGAWSGDAGQLATHMRQLTTNYGVATTDDWLANWTRHIQAGADTLDGFESLVKARAKAQYAHLANQIDAGMTLRDIADPYIATYAQTLEVDEGSIGLNDLAIQKALQVKDPATGAFSTKPMYEFTRQLKDDPRWDKTKNAETEAYRMVNRLGKDMGFLS